MEGTRLRAEVRKSLGTQSRAFQKGRALMRHPLLVPDLRELIQAGEVAALREFFEEYEPPRLAEIVEDLKPDEGDTLLRVLEPRVRAEVIAYLDPERQVGLIESMTSDDAAELLHHMPHDDRADLVNRLDDDHAEQILRRLAQAERDDIRRLASFEAGTAGAVMTTDYAALPPHITVREAYERLRREAPERETILTSYVVNHERKLLGSISLVDLILNRPNTRIEDIMQVNPISAQVDEDQEEVAHKIAQYDLLSIPIVDADNQLVGIVTHDDAMDILRQEQTEDLLAFGAVQIDAETDDAPYWQGRIADVVRRRITWLLMLFVAGTLSSYVLKRFEWVESSVGGLVPFIPLLIGTGGNAGSQTVGTIIRALALNEIQPRDALRVLLREMTTGFLLGTLLGGMGFVYAWLWHDQDFLFCIVISLTLLGICMWANCVGAIVPLLARRFGIDPAVVSAPAITTLVDATGLMIYYTIAIILLIKLTG